MQQLVRTTITLPQDLLIKAKIYSVEQSVTVSELVRVGITNVLTSNKPLADADMEEQKRLKALAQRMIHIIDLKRHPHWSTKAKVYRWVRNLRNERE